ncbi:MAG TPA: galactonate dehydratase [Candidatus Latescibacteria bacterium]|nr:galactonate dehydratase [Gemmatimonadota bacterium]HCV26163.1 galactonate dehydratase [Candidatus Latescibacterota bacterium]HJN27795.1 galactonate dehydratase [Candidatus Latescibacterota bacterium]
MKISSLYVTPIERRGLIVQIHTDEGLTGIGAPMNYEHGRTVERAILDMSDYLVGKDPRQIEDHWQVIFRSSYSRQMPILLAALSGIDMACLDILGQSLGAPIWRLLGGSVRDKIRVYSSTGGPEPEKYAEGALRAVEKGFTAVKMCPFPEPVRYIDTPAMVDKTVRRVAAVREAVGQEVDVALDFHRAVSPAMARMVLPELEPLRPMFVEEPTHPENVDALLDIAQSTSIPIATGERNTTRWGFREICEKRAAAVLQPDIRHCGGILEMRKIASLAEIHYLSLAPHSASDPLGVVASVHAMAGVPNFLIQEFGGGDGTELFEEPLAFKDGFVELPTEPGMGVKIDGEKLKALKMDDWRLRPARRHPEDDSVNDI